MFAAPPMKKDVSLKSLALSVFVDLKFPFKFEATWFEVYCLVLELLLLILLWGKSYLESDAEDCYDCK